MSRPRGYLSCDLDTVDRHLQGYGFDGLPPCDLVYRLALPRILDLLDETGTRCTFFVIARDARSQGERLQEVVERGHEVASHSWSHTQPFRGLDDTALQWELEASRTVLEDVTGAPCVGFRAPAWDVDERVFGALERAGYRYDASIFPTPLLLASRLSVFLKSRSKRDVLSMSVVRHAFADATPHRVGGLVEIPAAVSPLSRLPYYHTFGYMIPRPLFDGIYADVKRGGRPCSYEFHGADLLAMTDEGIDPRMLRHPGMDRTLEQKRTFLADTVQTLADDYEMDLLRNAVAV